MLRCALQKPTQNHITLLFSLSSSSTCTSKKVPGPVRGGLTRLTTLSNQPEHTRTMEKVVDQQDEEKIGDAMYHSFGEGYATRSEDEGFGVIYGDKRSVIEGDRDMDNVDNKTGQHNAQQEEQMKEEKDQG